jgi:MFS family permease
MKPATSTLFATGALAFASVLSATVLIPVVRPIMHWVAPDGDSGSHAFMSLNLLGGVLAAPVIARLGRRSSSPTRLVSRLAFADCALLLLIAFRLPVVPLLILRTVQGALNVGVLSTLLGAAPPGDASRRGSRYGLWGMAMMLGVALGAPLGTICLLLGVRAPLLASALLNLLVGLCAPLAGLQRQNPLGAEASRKPSFGRAAWWVFAERFSVGLFVVTFALHARTCLGISDARCGLLFTAFLVPFAVAVYPAGRAADRFDGRVLAVLGLSAYGAGFLRLRATGQEQLLLLMPLLGLSAAVIFASAMRDAATANDSQSRVPAMSALNAAGNLGMLLGTALAGILSALLRARGAGADTAHTLVFYIGGGVSLSVAAVTLSGALLAPRVARSVRVRS